jgi:uncharacterized UBP type Zn finger protein
LENVYACINIHDIMTIISRVKVKKEEIILEDKEKKTKGVGR